MSIARAYALPAAVLEDLDPITEDKAYAHFLRQLRPYEISPPFGHGGQALAIAAEFLRERQLALPVNVATDGTKVVEERGNLLACADRAQAMAMRDALAGLAVNDQELADYWKAFTGDVDAEEIEVMRSALAWLHEVFSQATTADWCLVYLG